MGYILKFWYVFIFMKKKLDSKNRRKYIFNLNIIKFRNWDVSTLKYGYKEWDYAELI